MTTTEMEKRRELQLLLLREGSPQDQARQMAADLATGKLDEWLERMRKDAMEFPAREIVPPGTVDLQDVKSQREEALDEAEAAKYLENQTKLGIMMAQSFSLPELPMAVLRALLNVLEINGADRIKAVANIVTTAASLQTYERARAKQGAK